MLDKVSGLSRADGVKLHGSTWLEEASHAFHPDAHYFLSELDTTFAYRDTIYDLIRHVP